MLAQPFAMYPAATEEAVGSVLDAWSRKHGLLTDDLTEGGLSIQHFKRWTVGEGIEKPKDDFAEEVRKMAQA